MIQIDRLSVHFGSFVAVDALSLEARAGQIFGFLGPNGAGKTTTIRVLTGVLPPTSGAVRIAGHPIPAELDKVLPVCGYVPDTEDHIEELSGRENLRIYAALYRLPKERVEGALDRLELSEAGNLKVSRYSKGMRKKLLIAREILHRPRVLFCDEPTANLDSDTAGQLIELMQGLNAEHGITFLFSTHDPMVMEAARRIVRLRDGRILDESSGAGA